MHASRVPGEDYATVCGEGGCCEEGVGGREEGVFGAGDGAVASFCEPCQDQGVSLVSYAKDGMCIVYSISRLGGVWSNVLSLLCRFTTGTPYVATIWIFACSKTIFLDSNLLPLHSWCHPWRLPHARLSYATPPLSVQLGIIIPHQEK